MKEPQLQNGYDPVWFNSHGSKVRINATPGDVGPLILRTHVLLVSIHGPLPVKQVAPGVGHAEKWHVSWKLIQNKGEAGGGEDAGTRHFTTSELKSAFGLDDTLDENGQWLIDRYGGTTAHQGLFIRWKDHLNIPGPGTGHDGDPNISIELDSAIKEAIAILVARIRSV